MILCPRCNTDNDDDARFCKSCGRALSPGNPGRQELFDAMAAKGAELAEFDELPPEVQRRRIVLSRLWLIAGLILTFSCLLIVGGFCGQFFSGEA